MIHTTSTADQRGKDQHPHRARMLARGAACYSVAMRGRLLVALFLVACSSKKSDPAPKSSTIPAPAPAPWTMDDFNELSGQLDVQLSEPTEAVGGGLQNQKARPTATIKSVKLEASAFENNNLRPLTPAELGQVVLREPQIKLRSLTDAVITHAAPNGQDFTVRDLLTAIEETERQTRGKTEWLGGIDVHHVFFEGLERAPDGVWSISWGS